MYGLDKRILVVSVVALFFGANVLPSIQGELGDLTKSENKLDLKSVNPDINRNDRNDEVMLEVNEFITIQAGGYCSIQLEMIIPSSPFADIYQKLLNFTVETDIPREDPQPVPAYTEAYATLINYSTNWTQDPDQWYTAPHRISAEDQIVQGIIHEHFHSYGIILENFYDVRMWGVYGGVCGLDIYAGGEFQLLSYYPLWRAIFGPIDANRSFDRASFKMLQIGYLQDMLQSSNFDGYQNYISNWNTVFNFHVPIINQRELFAKDWSQDFGNGTSISAQLNVVGSYEIVLSETLVVNKNPVNIELEDLLEGEFLCYKVFNVEWEYPSFNLDTIKSRGIFDKFREFKVNWNIDLMDVHYTVHLIPVGDYYIDLDVHQSQSLSGHFSGRWSWFRLKRFKAWIQLNLDVDMDVNIGIDNSVELGSWDFQFFRIEYPFVFVIGVVPVDTDIVFDVSGQLEISASADLSVTIPINMAGSLKAGIGWKRKGGWYPISGADFDVDVGNPSPSLSFSLQIKPSISFKFALIFYEITGPSFTIAPFLLLIYDIGEDRWNKLVGIDIKVGIAWSSIMRFLLGLEDIDLPVVTIWLWEYDSDQTPPQYDVWMLSLRSTNKAFITEEVTCYVDIIDMGTHDGSIDVDITLREHDGSSYNDVETKRITLDKNEYNSTEFVWNTTYATPVENHEHPLQAEAVIIGQSDSNTSNNIVDSSVNLELLDVAVSELYIPPWETIVVEGEEVNIYVTVDNTGETTVDRHPVYAFYNESLERIGKTWCECTRLAVNFTPGDDAEMHYIWDTTGVTDGEYPMSTLAAQLDYEIDKENNFLTNGTVTIIASTNDPPNSAEDPDPDHEQLNVFINSTLRWSCSDPNPGDILKYDIYLSPEYPPVLVAIDLPYPEYTTLDVLEYETLYHWKVVAWDNHGASKEGPIWNFTTEEPTESSFIRGDASSDGNLGMTDAIFILKWLYVPGSSTPTCMDSADVNDDGDINMNDALYLLKALYVPLAPPPPPPCGFPGDLECGLDPTEDDLDCLSHWCTGG